MREKALVLVLALILAVGLFAVACSDGEEATSAAMPADTNTVTGASATTMVPGSSVVPESPKTTPGESKETVTLTFSDHNPSGSAAAEALTAYANYIADNSGGRIRVDIKLDGLLYGDSEIFDAVRTGAVDAGHYVIDSGDGFYYALATTLPLLDFSDTKNAVDAYWALYDTFPEIEEEFSSAGLHCGTCSALAPVNFHWRDAGMEVVSPDQLKDTTLLAPESFVADWLSRLEAFAQNPALSEVFSMIDARAADGYVQHGPFLSWYQLGDDFQSHTIFGEKGLLQLSMGIIWNRDTWDGLPADIKQVVLDARHVYVDTFEARSAADNEAFMTQIEEAGHTVVNLTPEQIEVWKAALESVYSDWIANAPDPVVARQVYEQLMETIAR